MAIVGGVPSQGVFSPCRIQGGGFLWCRTGGIFHWVRRFLTLGILVLGVFVVGCDGLSGFLLFFVVFFLRLFHLHGGGHFEVGVVAVGRSVTMNCDWE